jgi:hypothetical protein
LSSREPEPGGHHTEGGGGRRRARAVRVAGAVLLVAAGAIGAYAVDRWLFEEGSGSGESALAPLLDGLGLVSGAEEHSYQPLHTAGIESALTPAPTSSSPPPAQAGSALGAFHPVSPARIFEGAAGARKEVRVAGAGGIPGQGAAAVLLTATARGEGAGGTVDVAAGLRAEGVPAVTFTRRASTSGLVATRVSRRGTIVVGSSTPAQLTLDVVGWYEPTRFTTARSQPGTHFRPVFSRRIIDTGGEPGVLQDGQVVTVRLPRTGELGGRRVAALALTVTAVGAVGHGSVVVDRDGAARSTATSLAYRPGQTTSTFALTRVTPAGTFEIANHGAGTDVQVDVAGYFAANTDRVTGHIGLRPGAVAIDTASNQGHKGRVGANETVTLTVDKGQLDARPIVAVLLGVSVRNANRSGSLTLYPAGGRRPAAPTLHYARGAELTALTITAVSRSGKVAISNRGGAADVRARVLGWHAVVVAPQRPPVVDGTTRVRGALEPESRRFDVAATRRYWTKARMASARPFPLPLRRIRSVVPHGTFHARVQEGRQFPIYDWGYLPNNQYDKRVGRLYFSVGQSPNVCSATVVARNLILTAAHCVFDAASYREGIWCSASDPSPCFYTNFRFAPGQRGTELLGGLWEVSNAYVYPGYYLLSSGEGETTFSPLDYALLTVNQPDAQRRYLGDTVGWFPISTGTVAADVFQEGYPAEGWYEENCPGRTPENPQCFVYFNHAAIAEFSNEGDGWWELGFGAYVNGGASGGPVFQRARDGKWYVVSVVSHGNLIYGRNGQLIQSIEEGRWYGRNIWGPYFNKQILDLWNQLVIR